MQEEQGYSQKIFEERLKKREIWINGDIEESIVEKLYVNLVKMNEDNPEEPIKVVINSYGGLFYEGMVAVDIMRTISSPVVTVGLAKINSAGFAMFMGGDIRVLHENTNIMFHAAALGMWDKVPDIRTRLEQLEPYMERAAAFFSKQTNGKTSEEFWLDIMRSEKDIYFTADQALKIGIATKVLRDNKTLENDKQFMWSV